MFVVVTLEVVCVEKHQGKGMVLTVRSLDFFFENNKKVTVVIKPRHIVGDGKLLEDPVFCASSGK